MVQRVQYTGRMEEEGLQQQQRMAVLARMMRKRNAQGRMDAQNSKEVSELLAADGKKSALPRRRGRNAPMVQMAAGEEVC